MSRVALVALLFIAGCLGPADEGLPAPDGPGPVDGPGGEDVGPGTAPQDAEGGDGVDPGTDPGGADGDLMDRIEAAIEQALREA